MFKGSCTALITPFKGGQIDDKAFERLVEWQIEEGTHGLVPVGTTGECPTLSHEEHEHVIELCVKVAKKRVPVIAGAGSNSTAGGHQLLAPCQEGRRRRGPARDGLLQQADAGRALSALQGDQRRGRPADLPLQRAGAHHRRHLGGDHGPLRQAQERGRRQGRHRQRRPRHLAAARLRRQVRPALGRGQHRARLHGAWRHGLHLGHVQHRAATVRRLPERLPQGRLEEGARAAGPADAAAREPVLRVQPWPGEVRRLQAGAVLGRAAAAAGATRRGLQAQGRRRA